MGFGLKESKADAHPHSSGIGQRRWRNATPGITIILSAYAALQAA